MNREEIKELYSQYEEADRKHYEQLKWNPNIKGFMRFSEWLDTQTLPEAEGTKSADEIMLPPQLEIGMVCVTKKGEVIKIVSDDMPNYPYECFLRLATKDEIYMYIKENGNCQHESIPDKQGMYVCKNCGISMEKIVQNRKDYEALTDSSMEFFRLFREAREEIATETGYHLEHAIRKAFEEYVNQFKSVPKAQEVTDEDIFNYCESTLFHQTDINIYSYKEGAKWMRDLLRSKVEVMPNTLEDLLIYIDKENFEPIGGDNWTKDDMKYYTTKELVERFLYTGSVKPLSL